jgi:hypothetical protein
MRCERSWTLKDRGVEVRPAAAVDQQCVAREHPLANEVSEVSIGVPGRVHAGDRDGADLQRPALLHAELGV